MGLPLFKGPEVVQKKIGQDGYPDSDGRGHFKADGEETGKYIEQSHIHEYTRASDNAELYELFQPFGINFKTLQILNISALPIIVKYNRILPKDNPLRDHLFFLP